MTNLIVILVAAATLAALVGFRTFRERAMRSTRSGTLPAQGLRMNNGARDRADHRAGRLQDLTAALLRALTPVQVAEAACREGAEAAGAGGAILARVFDGDPVAPMSEAGCGPAEAQALLQGTLGDAAREVQRDGRARTAREGSSTWVLHPLRFRDRPLGVLILRYAAEGPASETEAFVESVVQQCAQALERSRLYEAERSARVRAEFAERRLAFLASADARLGESLDVDRTLADVADLVVSEFADLCVIHVRDGRDSVRVAAASMVRDGRPVERSEVMTLYPVSSGSRQGWPGVLLTGRSELLPVVDDAVVAALAIDVEPMERLRGLGLSSQVAVPVRVGDEVAGVLTIGVTEAAQPLTRAELQLAEELAVRLGHAIDRSRLYRSALEASRAKSDFLAVISHELKTPLNAIIGFTDLMLAGIPVPIPAEALHQAERVRNAAEQLLRLVEDVLAYARAEAGADQVQVTAFPLDDVVAEAVALLAPLAARKMIAVTLGGRSGATMHSDIGKVRQILNNLISNAIKFTDEGEVRIDAEAGDGTVRVRVRDTGIGIEPEQLDHIFDPFWQVEPTSIRRYGGAGIGLGVVHRLSRQLGGAVTVTSEPGTGSTFELGLPLHFTHPAVAGPAS